MMKNSTKTIAIFDTVRNQAIHFYASKARAERQVALMNAENGSERYEVRRIEQA